MKCLSLILAIKGTQSGIDEAGGIRLVVVAADPGPPVQPCLDSLEVEMAGHAFGRRKSLQAQLRDLGADSSRVR